MTTATFAARAYSYLANYAQEAHVWDQITAQSPTAVGYKCLALSAYAAKNTGLAELAQAKLLSKVPKSQRKTLDRGARVRLDLAQVGSGLLIQRPHADAPAGHAASVAARWITSPVRAVSSAGRAGDS